MPSKIISCSDCSKEKKEIEEGGAFVVVSCEPLPDQNGIPAHARRCKIIWKVKNVAASTLSASNSRSTVAANTILPLSEQILKAALPRCASPGDWIAVLNAALEIYEINSKARIAAFLAQTGHESGQFNRLIENLNFSAAGLMNTWPKRFPTLAIAQQYERNPEKIGNFVYANRMGNGSEASGDGFKYRGRGLIQLTGRSNYEAASEILEHDFIKSPDDLQIPKFAALASAWFWASRGLNALADDETDDNDIEDFTTITKKINGGTKGLNERLALFNSIVQIL